MNKMPKKRAAEPSKENEGMELTAEEFKLREILEKNADKIGKSHFIFTDTKSEKRESTIQTMIKLAFPLEAGEMNLNFIICAFRELEACTYRQSTLKGVYYSTLAKSLYAAQTEIKSMIASGELAKLGTHDNYLFENITCYFIFFSFIIALK